MLLGALANHVFNSSLQPLEKENLNSISDLPSFKSCLLILAINSSGTHLTQDNVENSLSVGTG